MKFITVKSKQTTVSVDLVPPLVLGDKQRISLVDIRIPEQNNARRLQQVIEYKSQGEVINFEISITDKGAYLAAQENEVLFSEELAKKFNIPSRLKPYSVVKISGDEKYFVYCDLVEENNSLLSGENNSARIMPSKLLAVAPKGESGVYPELLIPADKRVINNITLSIENEKFEVPDFNDEPIIYVLTGIAKRTPERRKRLPPPTILPGS